MKLNYITLSRQLLTLVVLPLITISVHAAHHGNVDPIGTWKIDISGPDGQTYNPEATITKDGDDLKGSYYSPRSDQTFDLKDVGLESDNKLQFTLVHPQITITYVGNIEGNAMNGLAHIDYQGQQYDADFSAEREGATVMVVGTWKFETSVNGNTYNPSVVISNNDGNFSGTYTAGYNGQDIEMGNIKLEGNQLSFKAENDSFTLNYSGTIEGENISGTMSASAPQGSMDGSFTGSRTSE